MISKLRERIGNVAKREEGFTLIELMIVIAVLGILAGIAIPRISGVQGDAKKSALKSTAGTIKNTVEMYYAQNGEYPDLSSVSSLADVNTALGSSFSVSGSNVQLDAANNDDDSGSTDKSTYFSITIEDTDEDYKVTIDETGIGTVTAQ